MKPRLVTIRFSHFCEKARWALQRAGIDFEEEHHAPVLHVRAVRRPDKSKATPLLILPDRLLTESTDILHFADAALPAGAGLFPTDAEPDLRRAVLAWEDRFDEELGPHARRLVYYHLFQCGSGAYLPSFLEAASGPGERAAVRLLHPLLTTAMRKVMRIDAEGAARSRAVLDPLLADVEARLADGRRYLEGDRFTAADLTFAALYAVFIGPEKYGAPVPGFREIGEPLASFRRAMTERPAGRFVARLYDEQRDVVIGRPGPRA